jgi:hypothetical protein
MTRYYYTLDWLDQNPAVVFSFDSHYRSQADAMARAFFGEGETPIFHSQEEL